MRTLKSIYHFFPVQLLLLHIKKFQILLVFWLILFSTLNGGFMKSYGAGALFLSPEYLGEVSAMSFAIVGAATPNVVKNRGTNSPNLLLYSLVP